MGCVLTKQGEWLFDSTPLFGCGIMYAKYRKKWVQIYRRMPVGYPIILALCFLLSWRSRLLAYCGLPVSLQSLPGVISCTVSYICFVYLTVWALERFKLAFLERDIKDYSFEIYLSQCISIPVVAYICVKSLDALPFALVLCLVTLLLTLLFRQIIRLIKKILYYG